MTNFSNVFKLIEWWTEWIALSSAVLVVKRESKQEAPKLFSAFIVLGKGILSSTTPKANQPRISHV